MQPTNTYMTLTTRAVYHSIFEEFRYQTERAYYLIGIGGTVIHVWLNGTADDAPCNYLLRLPDGERATNGRIVTDTVNAHEAHDPLFGLAEPGKTVPDEILGDIDPRTGHFVFHPNGCTYEGVPGEDIIWVTEMDGREWGIPVFDADMKDGSPLTDHASFSRAIWTHVRRHD